MTRIITPDLKDRAAALEDAAPQVPPIFHHLFALLPKPGEEFPADKRLTFLRALADIADLTYGPSGLTIALAQTDEATDAPAAPPSASLPTEPPSKCP